jgi:hypothetical protein
MTSAMVTFALPPFSSMIMRSVPLPETVHEPCAHNACEPESVARQLLRRKAEDVILPWPFDRQIGEASYAHAVRKLARYGGAH